MGEGCQGEGPIKADGGGLCPIVGTPNPVFRAGLPTLWIFP